MVKGGDVVCDNPNDFNKLSSQNQAILLNWISENLTPIKSFNENYNSYGLKHYFENSLDGFYITNGAFKCAMLKTEYKAKDTIDKNWYYNISEKSKFLKK